jgi:hypothetical protein
VSWLIGRVLSIRASTSWVLGIPQAEPGGGLDLLSLSEHGRIDAFRQGGGLPQQFPVSLSDGRIRATAEAVAARLRRVMSLHGFQFKSAKRANPVKT